MNIKETGHRDTGGIHTVQNKNHCWSLNKPVMNLAFHRALKIPSPVTPLSAFQALCSMDLAIHDIFDDILEITRKNNHATSFFIK